MFLVSFYCCVLTFLRVVCVVHHLHLTTIFIVHFSDFFLLFFSHSTPEGTFTHLQKCKMSASCYMFLFVQSNFIIIISLHPCNCSMQGWSYNKNALLLQFHQKECHGLHITNRHIHAVGHTKIRFFL